ncbi:MAG: helix-turn-helix domain-containing protein [Mobilicoccus sp.]|nr:helix-turn-helix domain-containing protein [Mobilicoccus sp.]
MGSDHSPGSLVAPGLQLGDDLVTRLRDAVPRLADEAVAAIEANIPSYADLRGRPGQVLQEAVVLALGHFLTLASRNANAARPVVQSTSAAYDLGRGEARSGRSMDALLAAYRIGARVSWRGLSRVAAEAGLSAADMGAFAELLFAYIDELTAASVAGHTDELETTGRVRERYLERLARLLVAGAEPEALARAAERAAWDPPETLTAVALEATRAVGALPHLDPRTLHVSGDLPGLEDDIAVLLVPQAPTADRAGLRRIFEGRGAVIGPARPWDQAHVSVARVIRGVHLSRATSETVDLDDRLVDLVLGADPEANADLRTQALAPLADLRPATRRALEDTLRSWLLHQGRRADVAADLHIHPQTVRYRMGQVREAYGDRLDDPATVLALTVALGVPTEDDADSGR